MTATLGNDVQAATKPVRRISYSRAINEAMAEEMERARMDMSWQQVVPLDAPTGPDVPNPEKWEQISAEV